MPCRSNISHILGQGNDSKRFCKVLSCSYFRIINCLTASVFIGIIVRLLEFRQESVYIDQKRKLKVRGKVFVLFGTCEFVT